MSWRCARLVALLGRGPGRIASAQDADPLRSQPARLLGAADTAARMVAIDEAAREVGDRTTTLASEFLDETPPPRRGLLAALAAGFRC